MDSKKNTTLDQTSIWEKTKMFEITTTTTTASPAFLDGALTNEVSTFIHIEQ